MASLPLLAFHPTTERLTVNVIRKFFTPSTGSRARNIARAVLPALVILDVVHLSGVQVSAIVIALEAVFSGGAEISTRTNEGA